MERKVEEEEEERNFRKVRRAGKLAEHDPLGKTLWN
jgi:hypothetical protein